MAALDTAHAALALGLPTLLSPRLSAADPRERHRGVSHHTLTVLELLLAPVDGRRPEGRRCEARAIAGRPRPPRSTTCRSGPADLDGYACSGCHPRNDGPRASRRTPSSSPRPCRGRILAGVVSRRSPRMVPCASRVCRSVARTSRHGDRRRSRNRPSLARFEGLVLDFLSYLELERGLSRNTLNAYRTDLLQYGEYLSDHDLDALTARPADIGDFLADLATGNGRPACSAATDPPQGRLPALLLQAPAPRRADRRRPDRRAERAAPGEEAAPGPQLRRGAEAARGAARRRADGAARPGAAGGDVRLRAAGLGDDRAGDGRRRPARGLPARPRQGLEGAARAARPQGDRGDLRLPARRPTEAGRRAPRAEAVRQFPRRAADPPGPLQDRPAPRPRGRPRRGR